MTSTRSNPVTSAIAGRGKGHGFAVPNPGLSTVGTLGDAVTGTTGPVEVGDYNFITLMLSDGGAGGTVAPVGSPGFEPGSLNSTIATFVPLGNTADQSGAVAAAVLVYTYAVAAISITVPVKGVKNVRFVLTGAARDSRYTLHS